MGKQKADSRKKYRYRVHELTAPLAAPLAISRHFLANSSLNPIESRTCYIMPPPVSTPYGAKTELSFKLACWTGTPAGPPPQSPCPLQLAAAAVASTPARQRDTRFRYFDAGPCQKAKTLHLAHLQVHLAPAPAPPQLLLFPPIVIGFAQAPIIADTPCSAQSTPSHRQTFLFSPSVAFRFARTRSRRTTPPEHPQTADSCPDPVHPSLSQRLTTIIPAAHRPHRAVSSIIRSAKPRPIRLLLSPQRLTALDVQPLFSARHGAGTAAAAAAAAAAACPAVRRCAWPCWSQASYRPSP